MPGTKTGLFTLAQRRIQALTSLAAAAADEY